MLGVIRMFRNIKTISTNNRRTFKNFGHKRQPIPFVTTLWHGFLTFTFIGLGIEWEKIKNFLFSDDEGNNVFNQIEDTSSPIGSN